nr:hypothetical protein [Tanacetum cinerariifolium]
MIEDYNDSSEGGKNHSLQVKSSGTSFPQLFSKSFNEIAASTLTPNTLALMALQAQVAASKLIRPKKRPQQGVVGTVPTTIPFNQLFSTPAHAPNLSLSMGQLACGIGSAVTKAKKIMLRVRRKAVVLKAIEAITR